MKKVLTFFNIVLLVFVTTNIKANDTLVHFGQNLIAAPQWSYVGGGTNLDAVPTWKTLAYTEPGWLTAQPQAFGYGVNPPARNTAIPEDASIGGAGVAAARYPTLYFRKVINITPANLATYLNFSVDAKFDDGIVIWVNGVEAFRNNITANPLYATLATVAIAGNGADIISGTISTALFVPGNNIIAVEIHQSTLTSSDLFFDMRLIGVTTLPTNLGRPFTARYNNPSEKGNILFVANNIVTSNGIITTETPPSGSAANNSAAGVYIDIDNIITNQFTLGSNWKWNATGAIPAANWNTTAYSDAAWASGNGELGYGDGDETTCIPSGGSGTVCNPGGTKYWTSYFRKTINVASLANADQFIFNYKRDDGIVVYVNGVEVFRENMPTGAILYNTPAAADVANESAVITFTLNGPAPFVVGANVIAVEVHQFTETSSDISFDMSLDAADDNNTFSSSSADLNLPSSCSEVMFAGLYWGATLGGTNDPSWRTAAIDTLKLKIPGSSNYVNVVSTQTDLHDFAIPIASQNHIGYSAFADVTSLINATNANGTYTVANVIASTGISNSAAGWSMVIAYKDPSDPVTRNLVVFDGASFVTNTDFVDVPFGGFQTPIVGAVTADFGVICYDGDRNNPDGFLFKQDSAAAGIFLDMSQPANALSTSNSSGDSWNSTISYLNNVVTTRNPAHNNTLGFDADIIRLQNPANANLNNNTTSARLRLNSAGEKYYLQTITSAISVASPTFRGGITPTDLNGGGFAPNDSLRYLIGWQNRGSDTALNVYIVDTIPQNVVYKKNSLSISGISKTDAIGDDEAEWDSVGNRVIFRLGTGANATNGGDVLPNPLPGNSGTVSFDVNAIDICELLLCNADVVNRAFLFYTGKISGDNSFDIIGNNASGCASTGPITNTISGTCVSRKDTMMQNRCLTSTVTLPTTKYPGYQFYTSLSFVPGNLYSPPSTPITATGTYYAHILTEGGCYDTVLIRVRLVNCLDIDDDNDGIPDYIESRITGATGNHDGDGVPNWNDAQYPGRVDYNGDGVDDRFDAAADADDDGIPNYYDTDFTFGGAFVDVNNDRLNDRFDSDLDGIINQFDLDSDNDGIPDVVESYGADTNGDGIIDGYADTDGDGFSQNVDGSAGGATASGNGLDAQDLDGDGVPNFIDLDSDNDGLPDVLEVFGNDTNNNAIIDNYTDTDIDGFTDARDGDVNNDGTAENTAQALLLTGAAINITTNGRALDFPYKNLDRDLRPNAYDMDSDGDGIVDVIEAGGGIVDANFDGRADGVISPNGWSTTVSALVALNLSNSDGVGNPDYLDIDSDGDGIPDNIEGQPTPTGGGPGGYQFPTTTDADGDGLMLPYDNVPATFGGAGIFVYDNDGDGIPDYRDLDSDADGQPDIIEGNDFNLNGFLDDIVTPTGIDTDGDGLDDRFDSLNSVTNIKGTSYMMGINGSLTGDPLPGTRATVQKRTPGQIDRDWRFTSVVLPIHFLEFVGTPQNNYLALSWTIITTDEIAYFEIERSVDNQTFTTRGKVKDVVELNQRQSFYFADDVAALNSPIIYYRLKVTGKNGLIKQSGVLVVRTGKTQQQVILLPNPANNNVTVNIFTDKNLQGTIILVDKVGRKVLVQQQIFSKGYNNINLSLDKYAEGIYTVIVETSLEKIIKQLIITR